jgi:hypothetical protein
MHFVVVLGGDGYNIKAGQRDEACDLCEGG